MDISEWAQGILCLIAVLLGLVFFAWWQAEQESNAYLRATGKQISQWDALFLELRVESC